MTGGNRFHARLAVVYSNRAIGDGELAPCGALSAPPPVFMRNAESCGCSAAIARDATCLCTTVYVPTADATGGETFSTGEISGESGRVTQVV